MRDLNSPAYAGGRPRARRLIAGLGLALALGSLAACASARGPRPVAAGDTPPWRIPPAGYGTQRLYRVTFAGPQGEGSFKLTLRLAAPDRYQVTTADPLGRGLWSLDVSAAEGAEHGLWLDHRNRVYCEFTGRFDVVGVPLAPFPLVSLPALLLGRLPAEPVGEPHRVAKRLEFADATGRRWSAVVGDDGLVDSWVLSAAGAGPTVWWARRDDWSILSDRTQGAQVRWREVLREELGRPPETLVAPPGYRREECSEVDPAAAPGAFDSSGAHL